MIRALSELRDARKKNLRGSGIGLALVRHISEAHGGHVTVESEPGSGATFTVTLPVHVPVPSETGEVPVLHPDGQVSHG